MLTSFNGLVARPDFKRRASRVVTALLRIAVAFVRLHSFVFRHVEHNDVVPHTCTLSSCDASVQINRPPNMHKLGLNEVKVKKN